METSGFTPPEWLPQADKLRPVVESEGIVAMAMVVMDKAKEYGGIRFDELGWTASFILENGDKVTCRNVSEEDYAERRPVGEYLTHYSYYISCKPFVDDGSYIEKVVEYKFEACKEPAIVSVGFRRLDRDGKEIGWLDLHVPYDGEVMTVDDTQAWNDFDNGNMGYKYPLMEDDEEAFYELCNQLNEETATEPEDATDERMRRFGL